MLVVRCYLGYNFTKVNVLSSVNNCVFLLSPWLLILSHNLKWIFEVGIDYVRPKVIFPARGCEYYCWLKRCLGFFTRCYKFCFWPTQYLFQTFLSLKGSNDLNLALSSLIHHLQLKILISLDVLHVANFLCTTGISFRNFLPLFFF